MSDRTKEITHKIMASIKQRDTAPELLLRKALWARGLRYRKNVKTIIGKPDIVFTKEKIAVFCDGDYWHGHNWVLRGLNSFEDELASYSEFWRDKLLRNVKHDKEVSDSLEASGWRVVRIWESDIRKDLDGCVSRVIAERDARKQK